MKREELTPIELECNMGTDVNGVVQREPWKAYDIDEVNILLDQYEQEIADLKSKLETNNCPELHAHKADVSIPVYGTISDADVYLKDKVDAVIAKKDAEIAELKKKLMPCLNGDCILTCEVVEKYGKENAELKAKLEDAKASHYAEMVDAGMRERSLRRALWLARAERAKEHLWHDVNPEGSPKEDYTGHDWVLVQLRETGGFELIPRVAEYRRHLKRWVFIDENDDTENSHEFRYLRDKCVVIGWRDIDFAYYGKKFFVQQEINKNVERKCRAMAEEYR